MRLLPLILVFAFLAASIGYALASETSLDAASAVYGAILPPHVP